MVTEIEPLVQLTKKGKEKLMSHPKFWTKYGDKYLFKQEPTDEEIEAIGLKQFVEIRKNMPEPHKPPDDEEHILKESWRQRGLWKDGFVSEEARQIGLKEEEELKKKKSK